MEIKGQLIEISNSSALISTDKEGMIFIKGLTKERSVEISKMLFDDIKITIDRVEKTS